jgi:hypothetical protein
MQQKIPRQLSRGDSINETYNKVFVLLSRQR